MYMNYKTIPLVILLGVVLLLSSCYKNDHLPPANSNAYISLVNTSTDLRSGSSYGGNVTAVRALVEANGRPDTGDLFIKYADIYPQANGYVPYTAGDWKVSFKDSIRTLLAAGGIATRAGSYYTAILADSVQHYAAVMVKDDYKPVAGKALVRIMHFCPDGGEVVLYRDTARLDNVGAVRFKEVTPYIAIEPGSNFAFIFRRNDGTNQRVARLFTSSLLAGAAYTLLLKGYVAPPDGDIGVKGTQIVLYRN